MKKSQYIPALIVMMTLIFGCSFIQSKPTDDQIKNDIRNDLIKYNEYFKIDDIKIEGIVFKKIKDFPDKVAIAIVKVRIKSIKNIPYEKPTNNRFTIISEPLDNKKHGLARYSSQYIPEGFYFVNENNGKIFGKTYQNGYYKSDRGWLPGNF